MTLSPVQVTLKQQLEQAQAMDLRGHLNDAALLYEAAAGRAEAEAAPMVKAEALRRLGVIDHRRGDSARGRERCQSSRLVAESAGATELAIEAMNVQAGIDLDCGELESAEAMFAQALARAGDSLELRGRIEQNLGILANARGNWSEAKERYRASLEAFLVCRNARGCAIAYHNLGMIHFDNQAWGLADWYFTLSLGLARTIGDRYLQGLCLMNHAEVHVANRRLGEALADADEALGVFKILDSRIDMAAAQKQVGVAHREMGALHRAEERFLAALGLVVSSGSALVEAETCHEMAQLHRRQGRNRDALKLLYRAHELFQKLDAQADAVAVATATRRIEETLSALVKEWGQSIESADACTFGHCTRVSEFAVLVAEELRLSRAEITTIRLGAYIHDLGKVEMPAEILNKPARLTREEFELMKLHPEVGVRLLEGVDFPWDLKPIIRWHHEKYDGTGYPDGLAGEAIPVQAQIICIADVFDAVTSDRPYRPARPREQALAAMEASAHWWRPDVYAAFLRVCERSGDRAGNGRLPRSALPAPETASPAA